MSVGVQSVFKKFHPYPFIVHFQNGKLQSGQHEIEGGLYLNNENKKYNAVFALDNMIYTGEAKQEDDSHNFIAIRNKTTGKLRLVEVGNVFVKAFSEFEQKEAIKNEKPNDEVDNRFQLGEAFGSKRRKRVLEQSKKLKVDMDTMKEQLEKAVNEKQVDASELSKINIEPELETSLYAPPCNREASNVMDIYDVKDLITQDQLEALKETANNVLETEDFHEYIEVSDYMKNEIVVLKASDSADKEYKCCVLLYTDCIVRYLSDNYKKVTSLKYTVCSYSEVINNDVLDKFSVLTDKGRARPQHLKDKAVCYTIVLLLLSKNFAINDGSALAKAINIPLNRISQMCKVVGAHFTGDSKGATIVLKIPLVAPPVNRKKRLTR